MGSIKQKTREKIARMLGEKDVRVLDNHWLKKMQEGVIVTLHIGRWRARARLTYEDLGLPPVEAGEEEVLDELLLLGEKFLLPANYIRSMETADSAARKYLVRESYATAYGPFIPFTSYAEVRAELNQYREKYLAVGNDIADNIERITEAHLKNCAEAATQAYRRLCKLTPKFKSSGSFVSEDEFVDRFVDNITELIPNQEKLHDSFFFDIDVSFIPLPSLIAKDMAAAERVQAGSEAEQERIRAEGRVEAAQIEAEEERIRAQRKIERMKEDEAVSLEEAALRDRERKLDEMNRDVLEQARKQKEELIGGFMSDLLIQLRGLVYETTTDVLSGIEKNKSVHPKSIEQLRNLVKQISNLNFFGDDEIDQMINTVMSQLGSLTKERGVGDIQKCLRDVAILTRSSLVDLGETPRSARDLGVPDVPTDNAVRRSRESLGLPIVEVEGLVERSGHRL
jgi:hypothetical protein